MNLGNNKMFDITFSAGSVLKMVQNIYGDEFFKKALNSYLIEQ